MNALLGTANLVLQAVERHGPRAVVFCFGAEAANYRVELFPPYHADRPEVPDELQPQWADARAFFGAFGWSFVWDEQLEADDLLGSLATVEEEAGGAALLFTGDRDMFQCVTDAVTVLFPAYATPASPSILSSRRLREPPVRRMRGRWKLASIPANSSGVIAERSATASVATPARKSRFSVRRTSRSRPSWRNSRSGTSR